MLKRFFSYLALIFVLFILPFSLVSQLRDSAAYLIRPAARFLVTRGTATRNFFTSISQIGQLRQEKSSLQQQVLDLQQKLSGLDDIQQENASLRTELGVTGITRSMPKLLARVILQSPTDSLDHSFTVDVGSEQGVKLNQPAIYQGVLVGKITEVRKNSSVVRLITSQQSRVQAWITDSREKGLLVGDGNTVSLTEVTQGVSVAPQSAVETSGLGGSLPQGILIGQIGTETSGKSDPTQSFRIQLPYDPTSLQSIFILLVDTSS